MNETSHPKRRDENKRPRVSVVVRCYNEEKHICRLLTGIVRQTIAEETEIVIVDSGSTDATVAIASIFPTRIVSIPSSEFTFGRSLNLGCREARGEFLVFISAHCYPVFEDWLEKLIEPFEDEKLALSYGKQRGDRNTRFSEHRVFERWFPETGTRAQDHPFCNNANAAVRRSVWEGLPYDEMLTGLEDLAWAKTALSRGHRIAYVPDAEIIHVHDETWPQVYNRYRREAMALKKIFPEERFPFTDFLWHFVSNAWGDLVTATRHAKLRREAWGILAFRFCQFFGTYRGYAQRDRMNQQLRQSFYFSQGPSLAEGAGGANGGRGAKPINYAVPPEKLKDMGE